MEVFVNVSDRLFSYMLEEVLERLGFEVISVSNRIAGRSLTVDVNEGQIEKVSGSLEALDRADLTTDAFPYNCEACGFGISNLDEHVTTNDGYHLHVACADWP